MQFTLREFLSIVLNKDDKLGEIAECGGPSRGNTIIGAGLEDAFERGANVQMGVWASETLVQFVGKIFFA